MSGKVLTFYWAVVCFVCACVFYWVVWQMKRLPVKAENRPLHDKSEAFKRRVWRGRPKKAGYNCKPLNAHVNTQTYTYHPERALRVQSTWFLEKELICVVENTAFRLPVGILHFFHTLSWYLLLSSPPPFLLLYLEVLLRNSEQLLSFQIFMCQYRKFILCNSIVTHLTDCTTVAPSVLF